MKNFKFKINENNYTVKIVSQESNTIDLEVNGTSYSVKMKEDIQINKTPTLVIKPVRAVMEPVKIIPNAATLREKVTAPIPGVIIAINIKVGDKIKEDDSLLILEAMKMENSITAEKSGTVKAINVSIGQQVLQGEVMVELE